MHAQYTGYEGTTIGAISPRITAGKARMKRPWKWRTCHFEVSPKPVSDTRLQTHHKPNMAPSPVLFGAIFSFFSVLIGSFQSHQTNKRSHYSCYLDHSLLHVACTMMSLLHCVVLLPLCIVLLLVCMHFDTESCGRV